MILPPDAVDISTYTTADLLRLRSRINARLPDVSLEDMDLAEELVSTFRVAQQMLNDAQNDDDTPLSQKAAATNSITSALKALAELQKGLFTAQRMQRIESALTKALEAFPELQEKFFDAYEAMMEEDR
jgi:hypothetical protein